MLNLAKFVHENRPLTVLTGAGVSTASGLGDYRDENGDWKRAQPITGAKFINDESARKRYWARSAIGWPYFSKASPNKSHYGLTKLQSMGYFEQLITQNVDGLHQAAEHPDVIDLHGRLDTVSCINCNHQISRDDFQTSLLLNNPDLTDVAGSYAPDGDADFEKDSFDSISIPACTNCGGLFKPDVVFFGENVPKPIVSKAMKNLERSKGLLVIGSSLMVYSGFRFCKQASSLLLPIAIVSRGRTRADEICSMKISEDCGNTVQQLVTALS